MRAPTGKRQGNIAGGAHDAPAGSWGDGPGGPSPSPSSGGPRLQLLPPRRCRRRARARGRQCSRGIHNCRRQARRSLANAHGQKSIASHATNSSTRDTSSNRSASISSLVGGAGGKYTWSRWSKRPCIIDLPCFGGRAGRRATGRDSRKARSVFVGLCFPRDHGRCPQAPAFLHLLTTPLNVAIGLIASSIISPLGRVIRPEIAMLLAAPDRAAGLAALSRSADDASKAADAGSGRVSPAWPPSSARAAFGVRASPPSRDRAPPMPRA